VASGKFHTCSTPIGLITPRAYISPEPFRREEKKWTGKGKGKRFLKCFLETFLKRKRKRKRKIKKKKHASREKEGHDLLPFFESKPFY